MRHETTQARFEANLQGRCPSAVNEQRRGESHMVSRCVLPAMQYGKQYRGIVLVLFLVVLGTTPVFAQQSVVHSYAMPSQPLGTALNQLALSSDKQILVPPDLVRGRTAPALDGRYTLDAALRKLLAGSGLTYEVTGAATIVIKRAPSAVRPQKTKAQKQPVAEKAASPTTLQSVTVTGSRIRGAPPTSPVIDISQQQMIEAGQTDLGEVIRSIPQNFTGGQNPGVGLGSGSISNQNLSGGSSLDLRGLGPDATLTLLNGRRLSYDGFFQAVDISQIPLAAVDRIEIVADGASAIYGSDAVAGVANVILKPDYQGLSATTRLGQATSGGDFQQQYSLVGGTRWAGGGFIATLNSETDTQVSAQQRNYTSYIPAPYTLIPNSNVASALFSGHQTLASWATFKVDALYTRRSSDEIHNELSAIYAGHKTGEEFSVSPTLTFHLPRTWTVSINGTYGHDRNVLDQPIYSITNGSITFESKGCYCNSVQGWELDSQGPLFPLPGGQARAAIGAGYRKNTFKNYSLINASEPPILGQVHSDYVFGELYFPLVSPSLGIPFVNTLSLNIAVRHEKYNIFGSETTPKIGLIYAPTEDFDLKASWGKSFKTPDLLQAFEQRAAYLWSVAQVGGSGYPPNATALMAYGGNKDLTPERATSWTATLEVHPSALPDFEGHVSYFHIDYKDRVAQPITNPFAALIDPAYTEFVNLNPTRGQMADLLDAAGPNFFNYAGAPYDPANVIAIINDLYVNLTSQNIHGLDIYGSYVFNWGTNSLTLSEQASLLDSKQKNSPSTPVFALAGTVYNPPHWRSRLGATWTNGPFTVSAFYNFIGGVTDITSVPNVNGAAMKTIDLTGLWRLSPDVQLSATIRNLTNQRPPYLNPLASFVPNFDSTNYSPIGRFIGVSITKSWK